MSGPPRFASWLLSLSLDPGDRRYVLSDLAEEYSGLLLSRGRWHARRWYRAQTIRSIGPSIARRIAVARNGRSHLPRAKGTGMFIDTLGQDIRFAFRSFRRSPAFTVIAVTTLALGMGANTVAFSLVNSVLLNPVALSSGDRIVQLWRDLEVTGHTVSTTPTRAMIDEWLQHDRVFELVAEYEEAYLLYTEGDEPLSLSCTYMSPEMLALLEVQPTLGRVFTAQDRRDGGARVVLLTEAFWRRQFGADPAVVGQTIVLDEMPHVVLGVVPGDTADLFERVFFRDEARDLWALMPAGEDAHGFGANPFAVGVLRPGLGLDAANEELGRIQVGLIEAGIVEEGWTASATFPQELVSQEMRTGLWALWAAVAFVLLIACANIANMLLARSVMRAREFAVRAALGAGWMRVARQLLTESLILSFTSAGIGSIVALWSLHALAGFYEGDLYQLRGVELDPAAVVYTFGLVILVGLAITAVATLPIRSLNLAQRAARGREQVSIGGRRFLARQTLVSLEVALALVLFLGAGLVVNSYLRLQFVDTGIDTDGLIAIDLSLPEERYVDTASRLAFFEDVSSRVRQIGAVERVAVGRGVPPRLSALFGTIEIEQREVPEENPALVMTGNFITPGYFSTLRLNIRAGRALADADAVPGNSAVVVNEAFARKFFPGQETVGQRMHFHTAVNSSSPEGWRTIVGVVDDVKAFTLSDDSDRLQLYFPFQERDPAYGTLIVRAAGDLKALIPLLKEQVWAIDPSLPVERVHMVADLYAGTLVQERFNLVLLTGFALLALVLALVGVYGVISLMVSRRTREIGVRVALGAERADILRLVATSGLRSVSIGLIIGLGLALGLTRYLETLLYEVQPTDPITHVVAVILLALVGAIACYLPSRRATAVDPMEALRHD
jgi:putative ABC transport system permease protein